MYDSIKEMANIEFIIMILIRRTEDEVVFDKNIYISSMTLLVFQESKKNY